jgi:hypothetical protein
VSAKELIPKLAMIVHGWILKGGLVWVKEKRGWLVRFKEVFRYGFGRLDLEDRRINIIPRG